MSAPSEPHVHVGEFEAVVHDTGSAVAGDAQIERIARRVLALLDERAQRSRHAAADREIRSGAVIDKARYG
jgi:hypothetical protein